MSSPPESHQHNSDLLKFLARHLIVGIVVGETMLAALLILDLGGLKTLIWTSASPGLPLFMLTLFFALTFGSLAMGSGIIRLVGKGGRDRDMGPDG